MATKPPPAGPHGPGQHPRSYAEKTDDRYAERAASEFTADSTAGAVTLRGPCPRCQHVMEYLIGDVVRHWRWRPAAQPAAPRPEPETTEHMICTCEEEHPGRPADYLGCGAFWDLAISPS
jgi:hypothetical protein